MKRVGKTTKPFTYDLNQIPYNLYSEEVMNKFKGLDLVDRVPEELWMDVHNIVQEAVTETIPKKKKCQKIKWLSEEDLQVTEKSRERQKRKKAFFNEQCKEIEGNNRKGKTRDLFKKIGDTKGIFHVKMDTIKDRNGMDLTETEDIKKRW